MMRESASSAKGNRRGCVLQREPGGFMGDVYKFLRAHAGQIVVVPKEMLGSWRTVSHAATHLNDFYGCDIRNFGPNKWCLCGEFTNRGTYTDYVARKFKRGAQ